MTRLRSVIRGLLSLAALLLLLVVVPAALARWGQLPGLPDSSWWDRLSDTAVSDRTVFVALTLAAWVAWVIFATSVVVEMSAALRGIQAPRLAIAGPIQRTARGLVVGVLLLVSVAHHTPGAFASTSGVRAGPALPARTDAATVVVDLPASARLAPDTSAPPPTTDPAVTLAPGAPTQVAAAIVVRHGDSPWELAETHLGNGLRWRELWDLNRGVPQTDGRAWTDPQLIVPGWELRLPADASVASDSPTTEPPPDAASTVHIVESGDTLSGLAARYLGDAARYLELFDANRDAVQADGRQLTDPNLIVVGWQLKIPTAPAADPNEPAPAAGGPGESSEAPATPAPDELDAPAGDSTPQQPELPVATTLTPNTTTDADPTVPAPTVAATTPPPIEVGSPPRPPTESVADRPGTGSFLIAAFGGAVVLATGIALRLRWLRRRRATRRTSDTIATTIVERAVQAASDEPLVRWAGQHLATMTRGLDRRNLTGAPVAVELSEETGIEVLWDAPQHAPPPPGWNATDGGWAWRLPYDADGPLPADEFPAAIPALVTIGRRDGRQLLVDVEAFGVLTVTGRDEHTAALVTSIAVELATGSDLADAYVTAVGLDIDPAVAPRHRLTVADAVTAAEIAGNARRSIDDALTHARLDDTFTARVGNAPPLEAAVVVAAVGTAEFERLASLVHPRRGIGLVAAGPSDMPVGARIEIDPTGRSARLEPLGIDFEPVALAPGALEEVEATIAALAALPTEPVDPPTVSDPQPTDITAATNGDGYRYHNAPTMAKGIAGSSDGDTDAMERHRSNGHRDQSDGRLFDPPVRPAEPALLVRVLGVPKIDERPDIGRRELILAVLLACRDGSLAATAAQDALWGGKPVEAKTVWNFVAGTRRALGDFDDGSPVMPPADRTRGTLCLDPRVVTDLAVLRKTTISAAELSSAEAIGALRDALDLVGGPPFDAPGYDWAHRDQDVAAAAAAIEHAVDALVKLAVDTGRIDIAREGIARGLRGLPGDEHLYRARMRVEAAAGNHAGIVGAYDELCVYLADLETHPSPVTTALYHELKGQPSRSLR